MPRKDMLPHGGNETVTGSKRFSVNLDTAEGRIKQVLATASGMFRDAEVMIDIYMNDLGMSVRDFIEREDAHAEDVQRAIDSLKNYRRGMREKREPGL